MRYLKLLFAALVVAALVSLLMENHEGLTATLTLALGLPFWPLTELTMPVWVALILTFTIAFIFAIILELIAWYEYERMIRLQRIQIRKLQDALAQQSTSSSAPESSRS